MTKIANCKIYSVLVGSTPIDCITGVFVRVIAMLLNHNTEMQIAERLWPVSLRGRRKKGRGRGRGREKGKREGSPLSNPPPLFPFLPIPYPLPPTPFDACYAG